MTTIATIEQNFPKKNNLMPCFAIVLQRINGMDRYTEIGKALAERSEYLYNKEGLYIQPQNDRSPYIDGFQNCLDLLCYLVQAVTEALIDNEDQTKIDILERCFRATLEMTLILHNNEKDKDDRLS